MSDPRTLYDEDFIAWTRQQAAALRAAARRSTNRTLDWEHLAEEVENLGKPVRHVPSSQLRRILHHLLKLEHSPAVDPRRGWKRSVRQARLEIAKLLRENPSLKSEVARLAAEALTDAIALASADLDDYRELDAAARTRLRHSGYGVEQILGDWFPPEPRQSATGGS
ncbi:MAG: DUF29 domain-containing protein [Alphaproteobacteria bacterium]